MKGTRNTRPARRRRARVLAGTAAATAALTAAIGAATPTATVNSTDHLVRRKLRRHETTWADHLLQAISVLGEPAVHLPAAGAAGLLITEAHRRGRRRRGPRVAGRYYRSREGLALIGIPVAASLAATATHHLIKLGYHRRRPLSARLAGKTEPSFPSGHAMGTATVSGIVALLAVENDLAQPRVVVPAAIAVPLTVGFARLYTGRHWLSDVVGGWMGGVAIAAACGAAYELLRER